MCICSKNKKHERVVALSRLIIHYSGSPVSLRFVIPESYFSFFFVKMERSEKEVIRLVREEPSLYIKTGDFKNWDLRRTIFERLANHWNEQDWTEYEAKKCFKDFPVSGNLISHIFL